MLVACVPPAAVGTGNIQWGELSVALSNSDSEYDDKDMSDLGYLQVNMGLQPHRGILFSTKSFDFKSFHCTE